MDVVTGALDRLIPKLLQMLGDEYKLQIGVKEEVKFLARELESIHAFLRKVSDVPWDQLDCQVKVWAREARATSYDMEDILDTYRLHVESREPNHNQSKLKSAMKNMANLFSEGKARHDIGSAMKDIKSQLQEVAARRARYRVDDILVQAAATSIDPRLHAMYKESENLVGINKPRDDLISILSSPVDDSFARKKTVVIVGMGGIGKTTLVKAVFDMIRLDFKCGAFVPVGRNPNLSNILMDILYELDKNRFEDIHAKNRNERQLIDNLREFLVNKRYIIVIDDIWESTSWHETIKLALLENNHGSRIIITTRNYQVAKEITDVIYKIQPLSDNNSKKLFYTRIFGTREKWSDNEPALIANKILKKCDGVPLAIITMASLLVRKPRERWSDVFTSFGLGHKDDNQVDITTKILSFSYYDMPGYLRTCLLYLSVFPEDYMIHKESLIWRWIAEGFIQGKPGVLLFELGEQYFNDLVDRSMVQSVESGFDGIVEGCRVHDMVLDLLRSISFDENFVTVLDNVKGTVSPPLRTARRIALHDDTAHGNMVDMALVRSIVAIRSASSNWGPLSICKFLRVLDLKDCTKVRTSHLAHVGNLLHLRYLGLKNCLQIDDLPNEIAALKLLQILDLEGTGIRKLMSSVSQLTQLVCLKGKMLAPGWIGNITSLEELHTLLKFSNSSEEDHTRGFLKELGNLRELRVFRSLVYNKMDESMQQDLVLSLRNLHKLQKLELYFHLWINADNALWGEEDFVFPPYLRVLSLDTFRFSCLPPCIGTACLPNLTHLSLYVDHMDQKDMEFLGRLPELSYLCLYTKSTITISNVSASNGFFRKLRFCHMLESMIQFRRQEADSSIALHIWNGIDAMTFGSIEEDCCLAPYIVMPKLEVLRCKIHVRALKDSKVECGNTIGFECLPLLERVQVLINCMGASPVEVDEVKAALQKATKAHSNCPTLELVKDEMV